MIAFLCGLVIGGMAGVLIVSLLVVGRSDDDDLPRLGPPRLPR